MTGVGESAWVFKTVFDVSKEDLKPLNVDLVFDGIDTFASVKLVSIDGLFTDIILIMLRRTAK